MPRRPRTVSVHRGNLSGHGLTKTAYEYTIIWPDDLYHHGKTKAATVCVGNIDRAEAIQAARSHVAQAVWNPYCKDDQFIAETGLDQRRSRDLADWIGWQRRYQTFKSAGKPIKKRSISRAAERRSPSPRTRTALRLREYQ
jgi:hypothetical protein